MPNDRLIEHGRRISDLEVKIGAAIDNMYRATFMETKEAFRREAADYIIILQHLTGEYRQ